MRTPIIGRLDPYPATDAPAVPTPPFGMSRHSVAPIDRLGPSEFDHAPFPVQICAQAATFTPIWAACDR